MKRSPAIYMRLLAAASVITLLVSPPARSEPLETDNEYREPTLTLADLGTASDLAFYGIQGTETVNIPVPPGLEPIALNATTQLPVNVRSATITVMQEDRTISRVDVPLGDGVPISIPLAGAKIEDNAVSVTLRSYLLPVDGYCLDPTNPLRLSAGNVAFSGTEQPPTAVADFLPPVLRQLTIFMKSQPSQAESDAAVRLATAVASHYGAQNTAITVARLADGQAGPPEPAGPLQRQILVREGGVAGVSLQPTGGLPALLVGGPPDELINQSRLLTSDMARLALSSKAVVGPLKSAPQLPGDETTLRKLGQPGVNATALSPQLAIGLDQTRLGRSAHNIRVHLQGSYTPLPEAIGGQLVAAISGETVDRWAADTSGAIDRWVDVPDHLIQRYTNLGLRLDISGNTGRCGEFQPITLTIDGDSPVLSSAAQPPIPAGFQSMPQSLMPRTVIGLGGGFDDTRRAVAIMVGLQRLSALPIDTAVMPLADAIAERAPAVLISAGEWTDRRIALPVALDKNGQITVRRADQPDETTSLTLTPSLGFGSLQAVYDGRRSVLVATSNDAPDQLDALLGWLDQDARRWPSLDGTALIATPGRQPVVFNANPDIDSQPEAVMSAAGRPWLVWAASAAVALILLGAGLILLRKRRSRSPQ